MLFWGGTVRSSSDCRSSTGRGLCSHLLFIGIVIPELRREVFAGQSPDRSAVCQAVGKGNYRIEKNPEVGTCCCIEMSEQCGCEVSAGRRAHDSDRIRVDFPFSRIFPDQAHALLGVGERNGMVPVGDPVFEDYAGDAVSGQPLCDLFAFVIDGQKTGTPPPGAMRTAIPVFFSCAAG